MMASIGVQPPPSALLPSKGVKRESSVLDDDVSMASSDGVRPTKRVRFSDQEQLGMSMAIRRKIVETAIKEQNKTGHSERYDELRKKFTDRSEDSSAPDSVELGRMISCLTFVVSELERTCTALINDIMHLSWAGRDEKFQEIYIRFILQLVSAQPWTASKTLQMLVKHLTYETAKEARRSDTTLISREAIFSTAHQTIKNILYICPTAETSLYTSISNTFPFKGQKKIHQTTYISNLLKMIRYQKGIKTKVLGLIIDKLIHLDVQIQTNLDELDDGEGDELDEQLDDMRNAANGRNPSDSGLGEEEDEESDSDSDSDDEDDEGPPTVEKVRETVDKLDGMLNLMFGYYDRCIPRNSIQEPTAAEDETFSYLLHCFESTILATHKPQHTQFLLFWAAQKSPKFTDYLMGVLVQQSMDPKKPQVARQQAANYVASFVARAKTLDRVSVRHAVGLLCVWLGNFLFAREAECTGPDVRKFGGFYAVTQAIMYIFCFRWRDLRGKTLPSSEEEEMDEDPYAKPTSWAPGLEVVDRLITSRFNPLQVCAPAVVKQFAEVANHLNFVYCFTIMDRNRRSSGNSKTVSATGVQEAVQLDTYFPFDPFRLGTSRKWVDPLYVPWEPIPGMRNDEEEDDDEDEEEDEDDDDEEEEEEEEDSEAEDDESDSDDE